MSLSYPLPGVYRQDVFPQPPPLFLTGVPVFLGYASSGNPNQPIRLGNWQQFEPQFGVVVGYLATAVHGFFANGGFLCYVVRLADSGDIGTDLAEGLTAVAHLEEADLICAPDIMWIAGMIINQPPDEAIVTRLQQQLLDHCQQTGNRFCLLDALPADPAQVVTQRTQLQGDMGALYYPWLMLGDNHLVPPCGHVAGIYSRSDQVVGVHKAPANEAVNQVVDLGIVTGQATTPVRLTADQQTVLYEQSINYFQAFPGRGLRLWGARTLSQNPTWQQVNVRRLFITVGRWLERLMAELPFTSNDTQLWMRIVRQVTAYLDDLFRQGALKGQTAEQAFFVKCDAETNPPELYKTGVVITQIGLAAAVPAEFIEARVIQSITDVTIQT